MMTKRPSFILDLILGLALGALLLWTRSISSSTFVTWDEPAWVYRSVRFLLALARGDLAGTMLVGHPGVITMWSGALSMAWHLLVTHAISPASLTAVGALPGLEVHDPNTMRQLGTLLPYAKDGIIFLHAVIGVVVFGLLRHLLDRRYALTGALFLALDPYYLSLSRVLHIDALTSGFMLIAVLAALGYVRSASRRYLFLSGIATGLALLTKSYGALVTPLIGALLGVGYWRGRTGAVSQNERNGRRLLGDVVLWGLVAGGLFFALWPAMWVAPVQTLRGLVGLSVEYATQPGDATTSFFRGQFTANPGLSFYPVVLFLRTTPLALVGLVLGLAGLVLPEPQNEAGRSPRRMVTGVLLAYALLYLMTISLSLKKFDRYLLPALLALNLVAALGIVGILELLLHALGLRGPGRPSVRGIVVSALATALLLAQAVWLLRPLYPAYYLAYYNPWAGGLPGAVAAVPVGWGEGIEQAAHYLASKPEAERLTVATWAVAGVAPFFPGQVVKFTEESVPQADYVLLYMGDVQALTPLAKQFYGLVQPEYVVRLDGVDYAWLFPNPLAAELSGEIAGFAGPHDVILTNAPSTLDRQYTGPLRHGVIAEDTEAEVAEALQHWAVEAEQIIYVEYRNGALRNEIIGRQLTQSALLLWAKPFAYGAMRYYRLPHGARFAPVMPTKAVAVQFGPELMLEGYGVAEGPVQYRQELGLALQWRALRRMERDYHLFIHLVDEQGRQWGQRDRPLRDDESARSASWLTDTLHLHRDSLPLEPGIPPGEYWVEVGVYDVQSLARLDILDAQGQKQGTTFTIGPIEVVAATVPPAVADLPIQQPADVQLGDRVELLGYTMSADPVPSGDGTTITLFWRCLEPLDRRYDLVLRLGDEAAPVGIARVQPAGVGHPTDRWIKGEVLRYPQTIPISVDAASGVYDLYVNFYDSDGQRLAPKDMLLARLTVEHRDRLFTAPPIHYPTQATLGGQIELLGYDLGERAVKPGGALHLTLYWRALRRPAASYTVFTHLLDATNIVRGQRDSIPGSGQRPTNGWVPGEVIVDTYEITVHPDAPAGPHQIEVGLYHSTTGERLPVEGEGAAIPERRILLSEIIMVE